MDDYRDSLDVWLLSTERIKNMDISALQSSLPPCRQEKIHRIKTEDEKLRSLGAGLLLNKLLQQYQCTEEDLQYGKNGKPHLFREGAPVFNLSHSGDYVMLAFTKKENCELGADIQKIKTLKPGMANRLLSEAEKRWSEKDYAFLNHVWCIKEAFSKMLGKGITMNFRNIVIDEKNQTCYDEISEKKAYFTKIQTDGDYAAYVCHSEPIQNISARIITLE